MPTRSNLEHCRPLAALLCCAAPAALGATLEVSVLDRDGRAVTDVAVYAVPLDRSGASSAPATAVMEQAGSEFVPHMLIVQTGTEVDFPNNDTVSHHVYSFSPAKTFELALYKGNTHPPVRFGEPGVVVLGCNIHDEMLGYILVVDTPHHAATAADGRARLAGLEPGRYAVHVWTPRARAGALPDGRTVTVARGAGQVVEFRFSGKLMPPHGHGGGALTWDRY